MKLLVIAPYPVIPPIGGGKTRILELARGLARAGIEVTLAAPSSPGRKAESLEQEEFRTQPFSFPFALPTLLADRPFPYGYLASFHLGLARRFRRFVKEYDAIQFEQCFLAGLLDVVPRELLVTYDSQHVDADFVRANSRNDFVRRRAVRRVQALEQKLVSRAMHVFVCSQEDGDRFRELYGASRANFSRAPNGIGRIDIKAVDELTLVTRHPKLEDFRKRAIFSGSDVSDNHDSVRFILDELAPAVETDCAIIIQGGCSRRYADIERANVVFDPRDDTFGHYAMPGVVGLNPVVQGSGANLKVLNYLAHGLSVISTAFGMRGYDDLREFATVCDRRAFPSALSGDRHAAPPPGEVLLARYGWQCIADKMAERLRKLLTQKSAIDKINQSIGPGFPE